MRNKIFQIIVIYSAIVILQTISAQSISVVSIISTDIYFLGTKVTKSNTGPIRDGKAAQVITYHKNDYYSLKFSLKINENIKAPLELKLISPTQKEIIYQLEKNINLLSKDEFYDYNMEIVLQETGWYRFEIGDFNERREEEYQNIVFDKRSIYVKK
jgi:hypothetical protein